ALFEQSQIRNRELSALLTVGKAVTSSFDLDDVLRRALDTAIEVISADAAEIWLAEGDDIVTRCHRGAYREAFLERTRFRLGEGLPGLVAQGPEPVIVHDLPSDPRFLRQEVVRAGFHTFGALPLRYQGRLVGVLAVAALCEDVLTKSWELRLLGGIGEWAALAIENARLHQQVQDVAVLKERERIAREMHDGMGQVLGYVIAQALTLKKLFTDGKHDDARKELASIEEVARQLYADVREAILGLRTSPHQNGGAVAALREYIERYGEASNIDAALEVAPDAEHTRLHAAAEIQLVRIVQEALTNVRKHARADSLRVGISRDGHDLNVTVVDDGQGFDPSHLRSAGWPRFGLQTMRERAESVGGTFAVETAPGRGTRIVVRIPFDESERIGGDDGIVAWSQT
ncbi:MAG: GAF domain-containing sensor histidine kinase, partial [Chloroflexi bacterium]|nr:GAF domain-containing sensor histidine kinase [Chloroflexota bacterium]